MQKILIIGPAWIGDMVMAQTLFKLLKAADSSNLLHVMAPPWTAPILKFMPEVNEVIISPFKHGELKIKERFTFAKQLCANNYHQAIVLPKSFKSALIPFFAEIPKRTGWFGECRLGLLNDCRVLPKKKYSLMVEQFAALAFSLKAELPKLPFPKLEVSQDYLQQVLMKYNLVPSSKILALCFGAEYGPAKRWPIEYFAEVALAKINDGWQVWLFGGKKDLEGANTIQALTQNTCLNLAGQTTLDEAIALLAMTDLVISNDSGLMHLAAALQKKLVVIYGSSSPKFTPPLSEDAKIMSLNLSCSPCFRRTCFFRHYKCLRDLSPVMVLRCISQL